MKNTLLLIGLISIAAGMAGCSGSRITSSWKSSEPFSAADEKIMVIALIQDKERHLQDNMEDHVAGDLTDLGYHAVTSLQAFGPKAFDGMDEKTVIEKLKSSGVTAVMTIVLLNKKKERQFVARSNQPPDFGMGNSFWEYRTSLYPRIYEPGYYVTDTRYYWESNLYELNPERLVYSVQTETFNPKNSWSMGHEYGHMIISNMVKSRVLKKQR